MLEAIGPTLVCTAITGNAALRRRLIDAVHIDRLNLGPVPTTQLNWLQPHEGNLIDFLFRARAFQTADCDRERDEHPLDHRRRGGDVLRQLLARQRAGGGAAARAATRSRCCRSTRRPIPTRPTSAEKRVLFGGISIYLQQYVPLFRKTPRFLDRLLDSPRIINAFASRSISTDPRLLGDMTISMLEGEHGVLRKEFDKLLEWIADEPVPDVVNLPNSLLICLAAPLQRALKRPVCCTLQGEDLFLDGLVEPYRSRAIELIRAAGARRRSCSSSVSDYYVPIMSEMLAIPRERIAVVPLGINLTGYERRRSPARTTCSGSATSPASSPEKGLHVLAEAYKRLRAADARCAHAPRRRGLHGAGAGAVPRRRQARASRRRVSAASSRITARSIATASSRSCSRSTCCRCRRPTTSRRACSCSRRWRAACRSCSRGAARSPRSSRRPAAACSCRPTTPRRSPTGCSRSGSDRELAARLGARGFDGVRAHYSIERSTDRLLEVYDVASRSPERGRPPGCCKSADLVQGIPDAARPAARAVGRLVRARARRRRGDHGPVGQRQELAALHPRRARAADVRHRHARRPQPVSARCRAAWRRSATRRSGSSSRITACCRSARCSRTCWSRRWSRRRSRRTRARARDADRAGRPRRSHRSSARRALGRRAAARRDRARADPQPAAAALRRADRQPRSRRRRQRRLAAARSAPAAEDHPASSSRTARRSRNGSRSRFDARGHAAPADR